MIKNKQFLEKNVIIGVVGILFGFLCNPFVLAWIFTADHTIDPGVLSVIIYFFEAIFILWGAVIVINRKKQACLRNASINIGLFVAAVLLIYCLFEFILFKWSLPSVGLRYQQYVWDPVQLLTQNSKKGLKPHAYIAIAGDSYAVGLGDWLLAADQSKNHAFASQHLLFKKLGIDVITFGQGGVGSLGAMVSRPINCINTLKKTLLYKIENPALIVVYFYEGNDLANNVDEISQRFQPDFDLNKIYNQEYFKKFIEKKVLAQSSISKYPADFKFDDNLVFLRFMQLALSNIKINNISVRKTIYSLNDNPAGSQQTNCAIINNQKVYLPDQLDAPAVSMPQESIKLATYVFEQSLSYLSMAFPDTKIIVAYIPFVVMCYSLINEYANITESGQENRLCKVLDIAKRSDMVCENIKQATQQHGAVFVDTRVSLRLRSAKQLLHGPRDWGHFNKEGYEAFTDSIVPVIKKELLKPSM